MIKNVGKIDRLLRLILGLFLLWFGLILLNGINGKIPGIIVAVCSLLPFYMAVTRSCFVFRWIKIHSLSKKEHELYGNPYPKDEDPE